ncbi:MAG: methylaspartate mutase subunit S [bacterium]
MEDKGINSYTVVTGVIGDDVHNIGIKVLEHALRAAGFKVISLGIRVSQEDFIEAATETAADAILVSSLSGHARMLSEGFREKCVEAGLSEIHLVIGGHLVIGETEWEDVEKTFKQIGYNRVYPSSVLLAEVIDDLKADLRKS